MFRSLISDKLFLLAFFAAIVFWAVYAFVLPITAQSLSGITAYKVLMVVLAYPILEEAAFRGFVQSSLVETALGRRQWLGVSLANIVTSILFVGLHFVYNPWFWAVAVFVPSMVFGFFRDRHQSIIPGIILHAWYNSGLYILYLLFFLGFPIA